MKILAIDTSTEIASVALLVGSEFICAEQDSQKTHAQLVLPLIDRLLIEADLAISQLDSIIFGCGPGSFTGLRIACSIAKGLAYAHDVGLIPVSSLSAIAWSARALQADNNRPVLAVLDARMQEMYWSFFPAGCWSATEKVNAVQDIELAIQKPILIAGLGIESYWHNFATYLKSPSNTVLNLYPKASAMIQLAQFTHLKPIPAAQAQPTYVRNQVV